MNRRTHRRVRGSRWPRRLCRRVGFSDEWLGDADAPDHWREVHARLEGPIVGNLQAAFHEHWFKEVGETLSESESSPNCAPAGNSAPKSSPVTRFQPRPSLLCRRSPFCRPEVQCYYATLTAPRAAVRLARCGLRRLNAGVDVRVLLPGKHNDQPATKAAEAHSLRRVAQRAVCKSTSTSPTMIHSKTIVVDGIFSGASVHQILTPRSAQSNELDITIYDRAFGARCRRYSARFLLRSGTLEDEKRRYRTIRRMGDAAVSFSQV